MYVSTGPFLPFLQEAPSASDNQSLLETIIRPFELGHGANLSNRVEHTIHEGLGHTLVASLLCGGINPPDTRRSLVSHRRQDVVAGGETDEQRKGHEPDANAKVRGDLGKGGHVGGQVVIRGHVLVGTFLVVGEVFEPDVVIDEYQSYQGKQRMSTKATNFIWAVYSLVGGEGNPYYTTR